MSNHYVQFSVFPEAPINVWWLLNNNTIQSSPYNIFYLSMPSIQIFIQYITYLLNSTSLSRAHFPKIWMPLSGDPLLEKFINGMFEISLSCSIISVWLLAEFPLPSTHECQKYRTHHVDSFSHRKLRHRHRCSH